MHFVLTSSPRGMNIGRHSSYTWPSLNTSNDVLYPEGKRGLISLQTAVAGMLNFLIMPLVLGRWYVLRQIDG
jgi:hypothetical protein